MTPTPRHLSELAQRQCRPLEGEALLTEGQMQLLLAQTPGWALVGGALERKFEFTDFHKTMAFVNAVAWIAHQQDHSPDLMVSFGVCTVRFWTHSVGGVSVNDFICAARVDALQV